jgi:diaminohydroxyphosphoribosylaminopyrimidine deaminase / 5-amino-6-(5-phosphoribosylamino)uracil reductase
MNSRSRSAAQTGDSPADRCGRRMAGPDESVFAHFAQGTTERPFVVGQLGQSLDGRIATITGDSRYINGTGALDHLHRIRAEVDAVVVGVGTVVADDPLLTVRRVAGASPVRVVIDPDGRMPAQARCLSDDGPALLVVCREGVAVPNGAEALPLPASVDGMCPRAIVAALGRRGLRRILVEGGSRTISRFLDAGCLDRLHLLVGPVLIGSGRPGLELKPVRALAEALRPATRAYAFAEGDVLFDCDLSRRGGGP